MLLSLRSCGFGTGDDGESAEEMVDEGLAIDCCIGEGKLALVIE